MTTDLVPANTNFTGLDVMSLGSVLARSGYFQDARDEAQAVVKILAGAEMGIGPIAAMMNLYIVKGRVSMAANLMAAQVKRSGKYDYRVITLTDQECLLEFFEAGKSVGVSSFTAADAKRAGTQNMNAYPRNMLFARAMSNGAKWYCPDAFGGTTVYVPGEISDDDQPAQQQITVSSSGYLAEPATGEVLPKPTHLEQQKNGNGSSEHDRLIGSVQAFINCGYAIGVEIDADQDIRRMTDDKLKAAGKALRVAVVGHIQQLEAQLHELDPGCTLTHDGVLMKMKPAELQALGLRTIEGITELTNQPALIEAAPARQLHDGELAL